MPEPNNSKPTDHLANERTFLAWVRTSLALMGFGFVIVKFALFLRQISAVLGEKTVAPGRGYSIIIGIIMVSLGGLITLLAFLRYRNIEKQLNNDRYFPSHWLSILVAGAIILGSTLLVLYLLSQP